MTVTWTWSWDVSRTRCTSSGQARQHPRRSRRRHDQRGGTTATGAAFPIGITINGAASLRDDQTLTGGAGGDARPAVAPGGWQPPGGLGNDTLNGGAGKDAVDYSASATAVVVSWVRPWVGSGEGLDSIARSEDITGSTTATRSPATRTGNWISAGNGTDTVTGSGSGDTYDLVSATARCDGRSRRRHLDRWVGH